MLHHLDAVHSDWFLIGIALKIPHRKLRSLEFLHSHSSSNHCMSEMIYYWLDSPNASWDQVVNALELVGHSELALILKQQYLWDHPTCECAIGACIPRLSRGVAKCRGQFCSTS